MTLPNATQRLLLAAAMTLIVAPLFVQAQSQAPAPAAERVSTAAGPRPITLDDYPAFRRIGGMSLSKNGAWMAYTVTPNDGDATLFVRNIDDGTVHEVARGANASFSDDGRWIGYFIAPPSEGRGRGARGRGGRGAATSQGGDSDGPSRTFHLMDLAAGTSTTFPAVASFSFAPDGNWLLMRPQTTNSQPGEGGYLWRAPSARSGR
jgi:hypothetical protein